MNLNGPTEMDLDLSLTAYRLVYHEINTSQGLQQCSTYTYTSAFHAYQVYSCPVPNLCFIKSRKRLYATVRLKLSLTQERMGIPVWKKFCCCSIPIACLVLGILGVIGSIYAITNSIAWINSKKTSPPQYMAPELQREC